MCFLVMPDIPEKLSGEIGEVFFYRVFNPKYFAVALL